MRFRSMSKGTYGWFQRSNRKSGGSREYRYWRQEEDDFLIERWGVDRLSDISKSLKRSKRAVAQRAAKLDLPQIRKSETISVRCPKLKRCKPTDALPGSPEKIEVLRARVAAGEELWHPKDPRSKNGIKHGNQTVRGWPNDWVR